MDRIPSARRRAVRPDLTNTKKSKWLCEMDLKSNARVICKTHRETDIIAHDPRAVELSLWPCAVSHARGRLLARPLFSVLPRDRKARILSHRVHTVRSADPDDAARVLPASSQISFRPTVHLRRDAVLQPTQIRRIAGVSKLNELWACAAAYTARYLSNAAGRRRRRHHSTR